MAFQEREYPRYKLIEPFYADDQLFSVGTELEFDGCPNEQMEPLNSAARDMMEKYQKFLVQFGKPKDTGDLMREAMEEAGLAARMETAARLPRAVGEIAPMTNMKGAGRQRGRPKTIRSAKEQSVASRMREAPAPMASLIGNSDSGYGSDGS